MEPTFLELQLAQGGSIAVYASDTSAPAIPFWLLVFSNARLYFVGSDDVPAAAKQDAARAVNQAFDAGWPGLEIVARFSLEEIARAHEDVERPARAGRVVLAI